MPSFLRFRVSRRNSRNPSAVRAAALLSGLIIFSPVLKRQTQSLPLPFGGSTMVLKIVTILALLALFVLAFALRKRLARWTRYLYFMRFAILLWILPLLLIAGNATSARSLLSGIVTPSLEGQYLCVAFFLFSASCVALILARIVAINGQERFGDDCPQFFTRLLADDGIRFEWVAPVAAQANNAIVFWYFLHNGSNEGVDTAQISAGFGYGILLAFAFWYVVNVLYYLTYRPAPASRMAVAVGRPAARTLLFPRSWFFLGSSPRSKNFGDALELADLAVSFDWVKRLFQVPGYRWAPDGDLYECHYFSLLAACSFYLLFWVLWPITAPVPVPGWAMIFVILYLVFGLAVIALVLTAKAAQGTAAVLWGWKAFLTITILAIGFSVPLLYHLEDAERFPTLALILILVVSSSWTLGAVAFFADRYRVPVLTTILVLLAIPRIFHWDAGREEHYLSTSTRAAQANLPTPQQILDAKLQQFPGQPLIIVTSTGGGIHAAAWTTAVLQQLETAFAQSGQAGAFHDHLLLLSTVSGGSAGLYTYLRELDPKANGGSADWNRMAAVARCSSLEAVGWGLVYYDIPRAFLPGIKASSPGVDDLGQAPLFKDRTWALRKAFARNLDDPFCKDDPGSGNLVRLADLENAQQANQGTQQELSVGNLSAAGGSFPAFSMNTTTVENGERFLLANYKIPDERIELAGPNYKARSFLATFSAYDGSVQGAPDLPLATAAQMSATFPYVSSQARVPLALDNSPDSIHFADGGYYDNDGTASALEFLRYAIGAPPTSSSSATTPAPAANAEKHAPQQVAQTPGPVRILLVEIRNSGDIRGSDPESSPDHIEPNSIWNLFNQLTGPLLGFWQAGHESITARDQSSLELLEHAYNGKLSVEAIVFADTWTEGTAGTDPLNWALTPGQINEVHANATRPKMQQLYTCAKDWYGASQVAWQNPSSPDAARLQAACPGQ